MYYHLKIIFRNLQRQGLYSRINIAGLSVSLATVILITLWVNDELSFDKFHKHGKDIYLTLSSFYSGVYWTASAPPLATAGIAEIPEVENACRAYDDSDVKYLKFNDNTLTDIRGSLVDLSFFSMFDIKVKQGNVSALFRDDYSVILSESATTALFGKDDPMDKTIVDNAGRRFTVTGIIADLPQNSSIRCNVLFPFSLYEATKITQSASLWKSIRDKCYFQLRPGADYQTVTEKLNGVHKKNDDWAITYTLFPFEKQNLYNFDGTAKL